jgi:hypothetical protein
VKFGMDSVAAQAVRINDRGVVTNISLRVRGSVVCDGIPSALIDLIRASDRGFPKLN